MCACVCVCVCVCVPACVRAYVVRMSGTRETPRSTDRDYARFIGRGGAVLLRGALRDNTCFSLPISLVAACPPCPLLRAFLRFLPCFSSSLPSSAFVATRRSVMPPRTPILYLPLSLSVSLSLSFCFSIFLSLSLSLSLSRSLSLSLSIYLSLFRPLSCLSFLLSLPSRSVPPLSLLIVRPLLFIFFVRFHDYGPPSRCVSSRSCRDVQGKGTLPERSPLHTIALLASVSPSSADVEVSRLMLVCRKPTLDVHHSLSLTLSRLLDRQGGYACPDVAAPREIIPRTTSSGHTRRDAFHSLTFSSRVFRFRMVIHGRVIPCARARARSFAHSLAPVRPCARGLAREFWDCIPEKLYSGDKNTVSAAE